jgi:hypothetical protein
MPEQDHMPGYIVIYMDVKNMDVTNKIKVHQGDIGQLIDAPILVLARGS